MSFLRYPVDQSTSMNITWSQTTCTRIWQNTKIQDTGQRQEQEVLHQDEPLDALELRISALQRRILKCGALHAAWQICAAKCAAGTTGPGLEDVRSRQLHSSPRQFRFQNWRDVENPSSSFRTGGCGCMKMADKMIQWSAQCEVWPSATSVRMPRANLEMDKSSCKCASVQVGYPFLKLALTKIIIPRITCIPWDSTGLGQVQLSQLSLVEIQYSPSQPHRSDQAVINATISILFVDT